MRELGKDVSAAAIAQHYAGLIDGFVLDERDGALAEHCAVPVRIAPTLMRTLDDKRRLATEVIDFARSCAGHSARMAS
jgi:LPPG:FO 2-phospho-L-lactate transferase